MNDTLTLARALDFVSPGISRALDDLSSESLDELDFGVIGIDASGEVCRYNRFESECAGLSTASTLGRPLFTVVAPCMNNYLVAQRFEDAAADGSELDATIDYVLTLRMRPVKVRLRLLAAPGAAHRYVLVQRQV